MLSISSLEPEEDVPDGEHAEIAATLTTSLLDADASAAVLAARKRH